jgi:hypothetical protein
LVKRVLTDEDEPTGYFKRRSDPLPHLPTTLKQPKQPPFSLLKLQGLSGGQDKFFKVYKDLEIGLDFARFGNPMIESYQDDDVDTEDENLGYGI